MRTKNVISALLMSILCTQTLWSQGMMLYKGGDYLYYSLSDVDSLAFVNEIPNGNTINGQRYVDLGLPSGTLWATCNVGANMPNGYGKYFAWGEFVEKAYYLPDNYNYVTTTYIHDLLKEDDPAYLLVGDEWRTPARWQIRELIKNCDWSWEKYLGTQGSRVTGPNGNSIFLPAGSFKDESFLNKPDTTEYGSYWGREFDYVYNGIPCATELIFGVRGVENAVKGEFSTEFGRTGLCFCGRNIRPVHYTGPEYVNQLHSNQWSGEKYTAMTISYDSGLDYGEEDESSPNYNQIVGVPSDDSMSRPWYALDYEFTDNTSSWVEGQAPFTDWCLNFGDIYIRREFFYDFEIPEKLFLACGHDDAPCEYYLNGTLIWSADDGWNEKEMIELSPSQIALLKPGERNVLAFHVHQNWGGMYADCGLYLVHP